MISIIAGTGNLPSQACKSLLDANKKFFVLVLFPEDNFEAIKHSVPETTTVIEQPFYKVKTIIDILKKHKTEQVLFIGKVDKQNLLKRFKLDLLALKLLAALATKSDTSIMEKIGRELEKRGLEVISQDTVLSRLFVEPGVLTGSLTREQKECIEFGMATAQKMSTCDIGQTVIVKDKMILAVEAIEGTDRCIQRGIELGTGGIIVCKSANPRQNKKFDLPTIGLETLKSINKDEISVIAWDAKHTFIADKEEFVARAKKLGITLISV